MKKILENFADKYHQPSEIVDKKGNIVKLQT